MHILVSPSHIVGNASNFLRSSNKQPLQNFKTSLTGLRLRAWNSEFGFSKTKAA